MPPSTYAPARQQKQCKSAVSSAASLPGACEIQLQCLLLGFAAVVAVVVAVDGTAAGAGTAAAAGIAAAAAASPDVAAAVVVAAVADEAAPVLR